ncbi:MAG: hypothetical protein LC659_04150 [Myxococcales bacterium]|nr:hypothetical protein [Myxococcales bacterium]
MAALVGIFLVLVSAVGIGFHATAWMTWLLGVAGIVAIGIGAVDRDQVSRVARAQSLVWLALMLYAAAFAGWSHHVEDWQWGAAVAAATVALAVGIITLVAADRKDQLCK